MSKVVLITGASSGIGKSCADLLLQEGNIIFGTSRKIINSSKVFNNKKINMVPLDLEISESIELALNYVLQSCGRIDVLINNAGFGVAGSVEETPLNEIKKQFNANFFGTISVIQKILPIFRRQESGLIINISSLAGRFSLPYQGFYSATKFAIEAISESLFMELIDIPGIQIVVVEPGDISTGFTKSRVEIKHSSHYYLKRFQRALDVIREDEQGGSSPDRVAVIISKLIKSKKRKFRYVAGKGGMIVKALHTLFPNKVFMRLLAKHYRVVV